LRRLDQATNWKDVRARLGEIHEMVHHDLPLIPLWQTVNYFAYRTNIRGIGESPITLYQDVEHWESSNNGVQARATGTR
jgi:ABC-type transport system substrate-binding protein